MTEINFKGKTEVVNHHLAVPTPVIEPKYKLDKKNKVSELDSEDNLIIKGDNLLALKALLPTHKGRVKCIYIDPPYNTGNEGWCYNDNVNSPLMKDWFGKVVDIDDQTRHDKWLCMMYPRLQLLRELLRDDGVIFISIDDDEQYRLRSIMDEIFGEDNFVASIIWQKKYSPQNDATYFSDNHDYILCFAKVKNQKGEKTGWVRNLLERTEKNNKAYKHDDKDGKGLYRISGLDAKSHSSTGNYPIVNPKTKEEHFPPKGRHWSTNQKNMKNWVKEGRVIFGTDGKGRPGYKRYLSEVQQGIVPFTIWMYEEVGHNDSARKYIKEIFYDSAQPFDSPKPIKLIDRILHIATDKDSIILDSFSGSGTTGEAVMRLNKEDGGNRKFILIECEDYAEKITAERVRRVIKGIPKSKNEDLKKGLDGTFVYCELGDSIDYEKLLQGRMPPPYKALSALLFSQATGESLKKPKKQEEWLVGETTEYKVYVIYKPDVKFLESNESMLTLDILKKIKKNLKSRQRAIVFASGRYVDADDLKDKKVLFCHIPYELHRA